jgi:hypothetical protein
VRGRYRSVVAFAARMLRETHCVEVTVGYQRVFPQETVFTYL